MIKHVSQVAKQDDYKKLALAAAKKLNEKPVKMHFFPRFPFDKLVAPMMLLGEVPMPVLNEVKKKGGACLVGKAALNKQGQVEVEVVTGKLELAIVTQALATIGFAKKAIERPKVDASAEPPLQEKALGASYKDEDKKVGWRAPADKPDLAKSDKVTTKYYDEKEKADSKVSFDAQGRMIDAQGKPVPKQEKGFVMDPKTKAVHRFDLGRADELPTGKKKTHHHSSPLSGGNVAGAGTVETGKTGKIKSISDQSGHYKPDAKLTHQVVRELGKDKDAEGFSKNLTDRRPDSEGAPKNRPAKVELLGKKGLTEEEFARVRGSLAAMNELLKKKFGPGVQFTSEDMNRITLPGANLMIGKLTSVKLTTQQFEQTEGNEEQIRKKIALNDELKQKVAKVKPAAKTPTPPPNRPVGYSDASPSQGPRRSEYDQYSTVEPIGDDSDDQPESIGYVGEDD